MNRNDFWRILKRSKGGIKSKVNTIRNQQGKVVYEIGEILEVWRAHFDKLSTPKNLDNFDDEHLHYVSDQVRELLQGDDISRFLQNPISEREVEVAVSKLNNNKAPGYDGVTSEHVKHAGPPLIRILCLLYNQCVSREYIPLSFRKGIQVPLYKGKNACSLDCDNYRGITLLSTLNKLFEVIIWDRICGWWFNERIISDHQGAGRKGFSCIHTALTLQETISKERESNDKVFVAYFDVSKAFDSVWIDGLFYQLHNMGITGSLWRILYGMYINFECCVRIGGITSKWFRMDCGIHQGGYLSLVKYTAFINSLITDLEGSNLCSSIYRIKTTPTGYADDMATSATSKNKMDSIMRMVHNHGCRWRYSFNAAKSAVLVFGESNAERRIGMENRMFKLGPERVKERLFYDHVGVKTCVKGDTHVRTEEKVSKARKVLNMSTAIGIKKGGININTCNKIYWAVVVPTLCFGSEVWYLTDKDMQVLKAFQRYAARRIQRMHRRSLNVTSAYCLGWMNIVNYIKARKIIFIRTITSMPDYMPLRRILVERIGEFGTPDMSRFDSPLTQTLQYCADFDLLGQVENMCNGYIISKSAWKRLVWHRVWARERDEWQERAVEDPKLDLLVRVSPIPSYSVWWSISDLDNKWMRRCETMIRLLCHASFLRADDSRLRRAPFGARMCILCQDAAYEDTRHMVMQCEYHNDARVRLCNAIERVADIEGHLFFSVMMGAYIEGWQFEEMVPIWLTSCMYVTSMYKAVINFHKRYG